MTDDSGASGVQMPQSNGTLQSMKLLGTTLNNLAQYQVMHDGKVLPVTSGPWRHTTNGNPVDMFDIITQLMPDYKIVLLVERDLNRNVVLYCVNETSPGCVNQAKPITVFWLMIPGPGAQSDVHSDEVDLGDVYTEDLTTLERTLAYGVSRVQVNSPTDLDMRIRAVNGEDIKVKYDASTQQWNAFIQLKQVHLQLLRFRIFTEPRRLSPWPKTVELHVDALTTKSQEPITYHFEVN